MRELFDKIKVAERTRKKLAALPLPGSKPTRIINLHPLPPVGPPLGCLPRGGANLCRFVPILGNGRNTVSRVLFRRRELTEFFGKLGEFCPQLGEFALAHK